MYTAREVGSLNYFPISEWGFSGSHSYLTINLGRVMYKSRCPGGTLDVDFTINKDDLELLSLILEGDGNLEQYEFIDLKEGKPHKLPKEDYFYKTYREISYDLKVTVERVRQIELKALAKLRHKAQRGLLFEFPKRGFLNT